MPTGPAKVLTIGGDGSASKPKVLTIGKDSSASAAPKVLSIGGSGAAAAAKKEGPTDKPEAGSKVTAAKAVSKSATPSGNTSPSPADTGRSSPARTAAEKAQHKREADAVAKSQEEEVDDALIAELYGKVWPLFL